MEVRGKSEDTSAVKNRRWLPGFRMARETNGLSACDGLADTPAHLGAFHLHSLPLTINRAASRRLIACRARLHHAASARGSTPAPEPSRQPVPNPLPAMVWMSIN